jgi:hypothetical protein
MVRDHVVARRKMVFAVATPPKRFVLYSAETGKWTDFFKPQNDWGFRVWSRIRRRFT